MKNKLNYKIFIIRSIVTFCFFLFIYVLPLLAATTAGTNIIPATLNMQYDDGAGGIAGNENYLLGDSVAVQAIHGVSLNPVLIATKSAEFNETIYYSHLLTNLGNDADSITFNFNVLTSGWSAELYLDVNKDGVYTGGIDTLISSEIALGAEATQSVLVGITAPGTYISPAQIVFKVNTEGSPAGAYTGFNGLLYSGPASTQATENAELGSISFLDITALLHGYFHEITKVHQPATINVQFRTVQNTNAGTSFNIALDTDGKNSYTVLPGIVGDYYVVVRQTLNGLPLGVNHVAFVSSENISFSAGALVTINISEDTSPYFIEPFMPSNGTSPMLQLASGELVLKGGDASGERIINITDIIKWNNAASNPNSDQRGDISWTEEANFDGNQYMNTDDFSVWNRNKGQDVPLPEED